MIYRAKGLPMYISRSFCFKLTHYLLLTNWGSTKFQDLNIARGRAELSGIRDIKWSVSLNILNPYYPEAGPNEYFENKVGSVPGMCTLDYNSPLSSS